MCFHRLGRLRDRTAELQQHRASGLALVTAAIALWNTVYLGRALDALRRRGEAIPDALLAHLAPLGWQHTAARCFRPVPAGSHRLTAFPIRAAKRALAPVL